jgi:hypothetical protein
VLVATGSLDTAINIADAAVIRDDDGWRYEDDPSYASLGSAFTAVGAFAKRPLSEIHRFREAVA